MVLDKLLKTELRNVAYVHFFNLEIQSLHKVVSEVEGYE